MSRLLNCITLCILIIISKAAAAKADVPGMLGGGNFGPTNNTSKFEILKNINAGMCRLTVSENEYYPKDNKKPRPERFDKAVLEAHKYNITPMILFEYYTRWNGPLGGHDKWYAVGRAFAQRFAPNSKWLTEQGIKDWGITFYSAINEPMWKSNNPTPIDPRQYAQALEGLADGVHSINSYLHVSPGGFQEIPLLRTNKFGPAIAHLYNNGKLWAIDIHRYYDIQHQPMYGTYKNSLQNQFDEVKKKWGITADIKFYTTEFNFKKRLVDEDEAARGLLTAVWDALGVVGNKGQSVTQFAMPWNIFHSPESDEHYGMTMQTDPWKPTLRGKTLQLTGYLARDMEFTKLDPRKSGTFILEGKGKKLWILQNRKAWTDSPQNTFTIDDLPSSAKNIQVYNYKGLVDTIKISSGQKSVVIKDLQPEQTYMFLADI